MDGYVYLATDGELYKIGKSVDPEHRVLRLIQDAKKDGRAADIQMLHWFHCTDAYYAERVFHNIMKKKHKHGEWFALTEEDVTFIKSFEVGNDDTLPSNADETEYDVTLTVHVPVSVRNQLERFCMMLTEKGRKRHADKGKIVAMALREYIANHRATGDIE